MVYETDNPLREFYSPYTEYEDHLQEMEEYHYSQEQLEL